MGGNSVCGFCSAPATQNCGNCHKIFYCSRDHQKLHRKIHRENCFPAILGDDDLCGQHWVSTREIKAGELIFNEYPISFGPSGCLPKFRPICLGCLQFIGTDYSCSKCHWPVCNSTCEKDFHHSSLECPILCKNKIPGPTQSIQYQFITVLRTLLQKDIAPAQWEQLLTLESHMEERQTKKECLDIVSSFIKFIRESCKITDFDSKTLNYVYGAVQFNSYPLERYLHNSGIGAQLYYKLGKLNHSCVENTMAVDLEPKSPKASPLSRGLSLVAKTSIPKGHALTQLYGDTLQGTGPRQLFLQSEYYFTCHCARCKDPTELGTNYSAVKCGKCPGYLLPINPLDQNSFWKCGACNGMTNYKLEIKPVLDNITKDMGALYNEIHSTGSPVKLNQNLERFLCKYEGRVVHPNHYTLVPIKLRNLQESLEMYMASRKQVNSKQIEEDRNGNCKSYDVRNDISGKLKMSQDMMNVFDVLSPGNSHIRGLLQNFRKDFSALLQEFNNKIEY